MFLSPSSVDEHVHALLEEIHDLLQSVKKHQLRISNVQCKSMDELVKVAAKLIERQGKVLEEVLLGNRMRQLHYEVTLNVLAKQQRKVLELVKKLSENSYISIGS